MRVVNCVDRSTRLIEREFPDGNRLLGTPIVGIPFGPALTLTFSLTLRHIKTDGEARMTTLRHTFTLTDRSTDDRVFAWHWHPLSKRSKVAYPHVHIPRGSAYSTNHVPTGRVCLEDVVLFGFDEHGVTPTVPDGRKIVIDVRDAHKQQRRWS